MKLRSLLRFCGKFLVVAVFFAAVTVLVLAAYGYRYDRQDNKLEPTGIVNVDGVYRDIRVLLDGSTIARSLPVSISGVREGYHHLEIQKDGFLPWGRDLQVTNGMVSSVPFVILLPSDVTTDFKTVVSTKGVYKSATTELVGASTDGLLFRDGTIYSYFDILRKKKTPLLMPKNIENPVFDLVAMRGYGFNEGTLRKFTIDLKNKKLAVESEEQFPYDRSDLSFIQFTPNFKTFLFLKGGEIASITPDLPGSNHLYTRFAEPVKRLSWYYDTNHFVLQVAQKLEFCDDAFSNCYILKSLAERDSYSVAREGIYLYDSANDQVVFQPIFSGASSFLSYIFSEKVSL